MNSEERNPLLEVAAILIVVIAIAKKLYEKATEWANELCAYFVSIWPFIYATFVTIAILVLLYELGEWSFEKWKEHQKFIEELRKKIADLEKVVGSKDLEIDRLGRHVSFYKNRSIRFKNGLSRYHRLLVRKITPPEMKPKEAQQKVKSTLASVLKDFGASPSKGGLS